jgi:hypothetical protein
MLIDYLSNLCISLILFYDLLTFEVLEKLIYSFFPFHLFSRFDITGYVTGFGHPDWVRTHEAASSTSPVVSTLVEGGATCVGKTVVDEFAFSISGENKHYDSPTNPAAPTRIPGGACSGAAVAVATNAVDFALGEFSSYFFPCLDNLV